MKLIQEKEKTTLLLEGEMTVKNAAALWEHLLQSLKQDDLVEVNFDKVTSVDLSCLQLLFSAYRFAIDCGKQMVVIANGNPALQEAHGRSGFSMDNYGEI